MTTDRQPLDEPFDFFISYSGADVKWARWVSAALEREGYTTRYQERDFGNGHFPSRIEMAVRRAKWLVAVLSPNYQASSWCTKEWTAFEKSNLVLPVLIEPVKGPSLLAQHVRANLVGKDEAAARATLITIAAQSTEPGGVAQTDRNPPFPSAEDEPELRPEVKLVSPDKLRTVIVGMADPSHEVNRAIDDAITRLTPQDHLRLDLRDSDEQPTEQLSRIEAWLRDQADAGASDVVVLLVGRGSDEGTGIQIELAATDENKPLHTSLSLALLEESLRPLELRHWILLDLVDAAGGVLRPSQNLSLPMIWTAPDDESSQRLFERLQLGLSADEDYLTHTLPDSQPLAFADMATLAGTELVWKRSGETDPVDNVGLLRSPLAWTEEPPNLSAWCAVQSARDAGSEKQPPIGHLLGRLKNERKRLNRGLRAAGFDSDLEVDDLDVLQGDDLLRSPRSFSEAVAKVCSADVCLFDLTDFEPAVMMLLGIRAVIRRGITVCVAGSHSAPWSSEQPPFLAREISILNQPKLPELVSRIIGAANAMDRGSASYNDLPVFEQIRFVPTDPSRLARRSIRPSYRRDNDGDDSQVDESVILALVPFDPEYRDTQWESLVYDLPSKVQEELRDELGDELEEDPPLPQLQRTLDFDSPSLVIDELMLAIRLTDFCLVDLTTSSPNVMFELGARLAASRLHPVVILDPELDPDTDSRSWRQSVATQVNQLHRLLRPMEYSAGADCTAMAQRYFALEASLDRPESAQFDPELGGLPAGRVFELAWHYADYQNEGVATPIGEVLGTRATSLLLDANRGERPTIYPTNHRLSARAERAGIESLTAWWSFLEIRRQSGQIEDHELDELRDLTDRLLIRLDEDGSPDYEPLIDFIENSPQEPNTNDKEGD